ncbi:peptide deformylase [Corynebacterium kalidii]
MTVLTIRLFGDPVLRTAAEPVVDPAGDPTLRTLVDDMLETMDHAGGVGLAANQVGLTQRVFVYDCEGDRGHIINPVWEAVGEDTQTGREGCLSVPEAGGDVTRAQSVRVRGVTVDGDTVDREVTGLMARCVQHETDHLDGVMFFQRMEPAGRRAVMAEIRRSEWFNR